jgi:hypothetical protein
MNILSYTLTLACILCGLLTAGPAHSGVPITINTTKLDANGVLALSASAKQLLTLTGMKVVAGGQATNLGDARFSVPVDQLTAEVGLFSGVKAISGQAYSSNLTFSNSITGKNLTVDRLLIDFNNQIITGRLSYEGHKVDTALFSFDPLTSLKFNLNFLKGLPEVTQSLGNLRLQSAAAGMFAEGLGLPSFVAGTLTTVDFGTLEAKVRPWFRTPVMAPVPENATWMSMALGLATMLYVLASDKRRHTVDL